MGDTQRIMCSFRFGSRTAEPNGARRRKHGAKAALWLSMDCTVPWSDTRYLCLTVLSNQLRTTNQKSHMPLGCLVSVETNLMLSHFQVAPCHGNHQPSGIRSYTEFSCHLKSLLISVAVSGVVPKPARQMAKDGKDVGEGQHYGWVWLVRCHGAPFATAPRVHRKICQRRWCCRLGSSLAAQ